MTEAVQCSGDNRMLNTANFPMPVQGTIRPSIDALTGFRFVAAMMVFVSHYAVPGLTGAALQVTESGYAGVTFFFVLSGFIITYNYLDRFEAGTGSLLDYLVARLARVYPLYFFFIVYGWFTARNELDLWPFLLALQAWSPNLKVVFGLNGPAWSIGVEVFLYLCFPLLVPLLGRLGVLTSGRRLLIATAVTLIAMLSAAIFFLASGLNALPPGDAMSGHRWLYRLPAARLGDFLLGMYGATSCDTPRPELQAYGDGASCLMAPFLRS
jgi:peptidoglycan/LPS O-acetylase OafA/YrhL